jgi:hypothetical protein
VISCEINHGVPLESIKDDIEGGRVDFFLGR